MCRRRLVGFRASALLTAAGLLFVIALPLGCVTTNVETSDGRPMPPDPSPPPRTPVGAKVNAIALRVGAKPVDTNGNGYPDQISVEAYLFSRPHPTPIYEDGAFVFELYHQGQSDQPNARPISRWRIEGDALAQSRVIAVPFGPSHAFMLSMLETGGDQYPLIGADLVCRFEPADGRSAVRIDGVRTLQIGRPGGAVGATTNPPQR
jgi:hypothetical protein